MLPFAQRVSGIVRSRAVRCAAAVLCVLAPWAADAASSTAVRVEEHYNFIEGWRGAGGIWNFAGYRLVCRRDDFCGISGEGDTLIDVLGLHRERHGRVSRFVCTAIRRNTPALFCQPGEVLFELHERGKRQPITVWKTMQPLLSENEKPGVRFRRVPPGTPL